MLTIASKIKAALEIASPIRKLSDAALGREIATLRPLQELFEPKKAVKPRAPIASSLPAPAQVGAAKPPLPRSRPLSKGSIYSRRTAALRPIPVATIPALAVPAAAVLAPSVDASVIPLELRALLKLRLHLCEAEVGRRGRSKSQKAQVLVSRTPKDGDPKARPHLWSCAKEVMLDVPPAPASGDCHAKPSSPGNWVRLPARPK